MNLKQLKHDMIHSQKSQLRKRTGFNGYLNSLPYVQNTDDETLYKRGTSLILPVMNYFKRLYHHQRHYNESRLLLPDSLNRFYGKYIFIGGLIANYKMTFKKEFHEARFYILLVNVIGYSHGSFTKIANHLWVDLSRDVFYHNLPFISIGDFISMYGIPTMYHGKIGSMYNYKVGLKDIHLSTMFGYPVIYNGKWQWRCVHYNHYKQFICGTVPHITYMGSEVRLYDSNIIDYYHLRIGLSDTRKIYDKIFHSNIPHHSYFMFYIAKDNCDYLDWSFKGHKLKPKAIFKLSLGSKTEFKKHPTFMFNNTINMLHKIGGFANEKLYTI